MIYCDLIEKRENSAIYAFGKSVFNITGEVEYFCKIQPPRVIRKPKGEVVPMSYHGGIICKYKAQFAKGEFPAKVSHEIG